MPYGSHWGRYRVHRTRYPIADRFSREPYSRTLALPLVAFPWGTSFSLTCQYPYTNIRPWIVTIPFVWKKAKAFSHTNDHLFRGKKKSECRSTHSLFPLYRLGWRLLNRSPNHIASAIHTPIPISIPHTPKNTLTISSCFVPLAGIHHHGASIMSGVAIRNTVAIGPSQYA